MVATPTGQELERAVCALLPFVQEWKLQLNPDDLYELAYAVLIHANGESTYEEIDAAVRAQVTDARRKAQSMYRDAE